MSFKKKVSTKKRKERRKLSREVGRKKKIAREDKGRKARKEVGISKVLINII